MAKADRIKAQIKESISAKEQLFDFLDANPKGKGNEAYDYLVKRGVSEKIAVDTIKEYGHEHHAEEEVTVPSDTMPVREEDKPIVDEGDYKTEEDPLAPIVQETKKSKEYLNTYKLRVRTL